MALSDYKHGIIIPSYTTDERVGVTSTTGSVIFNTTTNKLQRYNGTTWNDI
tara:strand:+ start:80 stop:232 length:153 start_codon:yes stop_codon:yes gene_type:complete